MKFLVAVLFMVTVLSAKPHSVAQVKKEYYKVQRMVSNGELSMRKRGWDGGNVSKDAKIYTDDNGVVRFLVLEGGLEDSAHKGEYTYDRDGELIFSYTHDGNVGGCWLDVRSYYSGYRVLKRKRKSGRCKPSRAYPLRVDNPRRAFRKVENE